MISHHEDYKSHSPAALTARFINQHVLLYANPFPGAQGQSCKSQVVLRTHALAIPSQGLTAMPYHCYMFLFSLEYLRKGERGSWFSARCGWYWQFTNGHLLQGSASFLTFSAFLSVYSWFFGLSSHGLSHLLNFKKNEHLGQPHMIEAKWCTGKSRRI